MAPPLPTRTPEERLTVPAIELNTDFPLSPPVLQSRKEDIGWWIWQVMNHGTAPAEHGRRDFRRLGRLEHTGLVDVDWGTTRATVTYRQTVNADAPGTYRHRWWFEPMWREARERAVSRGRRSTIPAAVRAFVYRRDVVCQLCGTTERPSLDHIIPWSQGGTDAVDNLRLLCIPCNSRRGAARFDDETLRNGAQSG